MRAKVERLWLKGTTFDSEGPRPKGTSFANRPTIVCSPLTAGAPTTYAPVRGDPADNQRTHPPAHHKSKVSHTLITTILLKNSAL